MLEDDPKDRCSTDGVASYHTTWWCPFLREWPGFAKLVEEFELLLDAYTTSELDHIEDPDNDPIDANTIGLVQRDAEERRNGFKAALLDLTYRPTNGQGPERSETRGNNATGSNHG
jgi:hypothetical protein